MICTPRRNNEIFNYLVEFSNNSVTYAFTWSASQAMGWLSIITVIIKAILAPLTVKQIKSMKAMQELQPRMKEENTKNDPSTSLQAEICYVQRNGCKPIGWLLVFIGKCRSD